MLLLLMETTAAWTVKDPTPSRTSRYVRPLASRLLGMSEIHEKCNFTFTTPYDSSDDYFHGFGCASQVHVGMASGTSVFVSFVSPSSTTESRIDFGTTKEFLDRTAFGEVNSYTALISIEKDLYEPPMGRPFASEEEVLDLANTTWWAKGISGSRTNPSEVPDGLLPYKNPASIYSSPFLHTVLLDNLSPGTRYYYRLPLIKGSTSSDEIIRTFQIPKTTYPTHLGLMGDVGQTEVSNQSLQEFWQSDPDAILLAGDLSYADGWPFLWDSFAALAERVFSKIPVVTTGGNHEISNSENWLHYLFRWPTPHVASKSTSALYFSVDIGTAHIVSLNSYDNFVNGGDRNQREWLLQDLKQVDRSKTPWIIVMLHAPFYNSNYGHALEAELMRQSYEPIFYAHAVDFVIAGHVHAYERSIPVYNYEPDVCGTVHLGLGDAGNRENTYLNWTKPQPSYSAFRESSFGVANLVLHSNTKATYEWKRDACGIKPWDEENLGIDFDFLNCRSKGDNGGFAYETTDSVTYIKERFLVDDLFCKVKRQEVVQRAGLSMNYFPLLRNDTSDLEDDSTTDDSSSSSDEAVSKRSGKKKKTLKVTAGITILIALLSAIVSFIAGARLGQRGFFDQGGPQSSASSPGGTQMMKVNQKYDTVADEDEKEMV